MLYIFYIFYILYFFMLYILYILYICIPSFSFNVNTNSKFYWFIFYVGLSRSSAFIYDIILIESAYPHQYSNYRCSHHNTLYHNMKVSYWITDRSIMVTLLIRFNRRSNVLKRIPTQCQLKLFIPHE